MCCRLQLDLRELLARGNGLFGSAEQTGSIGVVPATPVASTPVASAPATPSPTAEAPPMMSAAPPEIPTPSKKEVESFTEWPQVLQALIHTNTALHGALVNTAAYRYRDIVLVGL